MNDRRQWIPIGGLIATAAAAMYMVVQLSAQATGVTGNFTNAAAAEVRDAQGQVVLQGQFAVAEEDDDDVERKAVLEPTGVVAGAAGEAEVEFAKSAPVTQEIEFTVRGVQAGGVHVRDRRPGGRDRDGGSERHCRSGAGRQDARRAGEVASGA